MKSFLLRVFYFFIIIIIFKNVALIWKFTEERQDIWGEGALNHKDDQLLIYDNCCGYAYDILTRKESY